MSLMPEEASRSCCLLTCAMPSVSHSSATLGVIVGKSGISIVLKPADGPLMEVNLGHTHTTGIVQSLRELVDDNLSAMF